VKATNRIPGQLTARERYEAAIKASTVTPEQRRKAFENAAKSPGLQAALDDADLAIEQRVKELEARELHGRNGS
jgi:3-hydroxyacyl-CoA dehydrogenase